MKGSRTKLFWRSKRGDEIKRNGDPRNFIAQGMVEFALVLPLLLLLVFGIAELGRLFLIYASVTAASREGARYGSAAGRNTIGQYYYMDCEGIRAAVKRVSMLVNVQDSDITIGYDQGPTDVCDPSDLNEPLLPCTCPVSDPNDVKLGDRLLVTVSANYEPLLGMTSLQPFPINSVARRSILKGVPIEGLTTSTNTPPVVIITAPADGSVIAVNTSINFIGIATDTEDGNISDKLVWKDVSTNTIIGNGDNFSTNSLALGTHIIRADVTDSGGLTGSDAISIEINSPPVVTIITPADGATFEEGQSIGFSGTAIDLEDVDISTKLVWTDGATTIGNGASFTTSLMGVGTHTITASATDSDGLSGSASITINIIAKAPPVVTITSPVDGATFDYGDSILFSGTAIDFEDGDLTASLSWVSSIDGSIDSGGSFSISTLAGGLHTITASVTDSDGLVGSASVSINIFIPDPPVVIITSPGDQSEFYQGDSISFIATANDLQDGNLTYAIEWYSDIDGHIGSGGSFSESNLSLGTHTIRAEVTDADGNLVWDEVEITVVGNTPPLVTIIRPSANEEFFVEKPVGFQGEVFDEQDTNLTPSLTWYSSLMSGVIGTGGVFTRTDLIAGTHLITATVTDSGGLTSFATRTIKIVTEPCRIRPEPLIQELYTVVWPFTNLSEDTYILNVVTFPWASEPEGQFLSNIKFEATWEYGNVIWNGPLLIPGTYTFGPLGPPTYNFAWTGGNRTFEGGMNRKESLTFRFQKPNIKPDTVPGTIYAVFLKLNSSETCTYSTRWSIP